MRGYAGIDRNLTACVHFVRNAEVDDDDAFIFSEVRRLDLKCVYLDSRSVSGDVWSITSVIGSLLGLGHAPYTKENYNLQLPSWTPFWDDLCDLSQACNGLVLIIGNARELLARNEDIAFDLIEAFLFQLDCWQREVKPCHLCLQMDDNDYITRLLASP